MDPYYGQPIQKSPVVMQQPAAGQTTVIQVGQVNPMMPRGIPRDWTSGLCACCDDMGVCLLAIFVPCHECILASEMGEGCCMPCFVPASILVMRAHFRGKHNIQGSILNDCCTTVFCGPCASCQLAREVKMVKNGQAQP